MVNMKQLHTFSYGLLPFVLFTVILYAFFYNHHLLFAEQLRLFEWNKDYFNEIVYNPGGLSAYIGEFFTQFYHLNHFGGWILGAGVGLTGILYRNLICHWKIGGNVSWELIPITSLVFFYLNPNASLGLIFGLLITLTCKNNSSWKGRQTQKTSDPNQLTDLLFLYWNRLLFISYSHLPRWSFFEEKTLTSCLDSIYTRYNPTAYLNLL